MRSVSHLVATVLVVGCSSASPPADGAPAMPAASASTVATIASSSATASAAPPAESAAATMSSLDAVALAAGNLPPALRKKMEELCATDANTLHAGLACENLAALHREGGMGVEENKPLSETLFERGRGKAVFACRGGEIPACSHIGLMNALKLRTLDPNSEKAKTWADASGPWLTLACNGGDPVSCDALADILEVGRGVPKNPGAAKQVREREAALRAAGNK